MPNLSELSSSNQCVSFGVYDEGRGGQWLANRSIGYAFNYDNTLYNPYFTESQEESHRYRTAPALITHDMTYHQPYCQLDTPFPESNTSSENGQIQTNEDSAGAYVENLSNGLNSHNNGSDEEIQRINSIIPSIRNGRNIFAEVLLRNVYSEPTDNCSATEAMVCNATDSYMQFTKPVVTASDVSSTSSCSSSPSDLSAINGDLNGKSTVIRHLSDGIYPANASHLKYLSENGVQSGSTPQIVSSAFLENQTNVSSNGLSLSPEDRSGLLVGTGYTSVIVEAQHYQPFPASGFVQ